MLAIRDFLIFILGSRFALMQMKALFFYLLLNFNIQPYNETQIPLKIVNSAMLWITEKGINLELQPRTEPEK